MRKLIPLLLIAGLSAALWAQESGRSVVRQGVITEDLYAAGESVHILAQIHGDVTAAGARVTVDRQVTGDVMAAGGEVTIRADVSDDVRAAGGEVVITGKVGDDAVVAGGEVRLAPGATVGGRAWFAGGDVEVAGRVAKELRARAGTVVISGDIQGNADLVAEHIRILSTARIRGDLVYSSAHRPEIDPGARIEGRIIERPLPAFEGPTTMQRAALGLTFGISLAVAGIALFLIFPDFSLAAAGTIGGEPLKSLGLGLVALVVTPVVVALLLASVIGCLLGLALLAVFLVSLLAGVLTGVLYVADTGARLLGKSEGASKGGRALSIIVAVAVLALIQVVPLIGCVIVFLLFLAGFGALELRAYRSYRALRP